MSGSVSIIDSGVANLASVLGALQRLGVEAEVTAEAAKIRAAKHVILPGVGAAGPAMAQLRAKGLVDVIRGLTQPVLGICLGMQLLFARSDEGETGESCLGIIPADVRRMQPTADQPVPHMGWNKITLLHPEHPLLRGVVDSSYVYYVHGFAVPVGDYTIATTDYGGTFTAIAAQGNFHGCQFHPERSSSVGSQILKNFLEL